MMSNRVDDSAINIADGTEPNMAASVANVTINSAVHHEELSNTQMDEHFMRLALEQAHRAADLGEVPIGAVVVHNGEVVAAAHNRREMDNNPSAHAEFLALCQASQTLKRWRLTGCTVYVTLEPCPMCAGLMVNARIDRCVFGAHDPKGGALGTLYELHQDDRLNHAFQVTSGVLQEECSTILKDFFRKRRAR